MSENKTALSLNEKIATIINEKFWVSGEYEGDYECGDLAAANAIETLIRTMVEDAWDECDKWKGWTTDLERKKTEYIKSIFENEK